jgi:hypothetical protein
MEVGAVPQTTNWGVEVGKGVLGLVLGFVGGVAMEKYKARKSRHTLVATYLDGLATALEGMAEGFEERKIPYGEGQTAFRMFLESKNVIPGYLEQNEIDRIEELFNSADGFHGVIRSNRESTKLMIESIDMARRIAGILRARAAVLRLK